MKLDIDPSLDDGCLMSHEEMIELERRFTPNIRGNMPELIKRLGELRSEPPAFSK
jgi:hypothetical protein